MTGLRKIGADLDLLLKVRERLTDPNNWCQFKRVDSLSGRTCMVGAYALVRYGRAEANGEKLDIYTEFQHLVGERTHMAASNFNDSHTHAEVLGYLDAVISSRVAV